MKTFKKLAFILLSSSIFLGITSCSKDNRGQDLTNNTNIVENSNIEIKLLKSTPKRKVSNRFYKSNISGTGATYVPPAALFGTLQEINVGAGYDHVVINVTYVTQPTRFSVKTETLGYESQYLNGTIGYNSSTGYFTYGIFVETPGNIITFSFEVLCYKKFEVSSKTYSYSINPSNTTFNQVSYSLAYADGSSCDDVMKISLDSNNKQFTLTNTAEFEKKILLKLYLTYYPSVYSNIYITY